MFVLVKIYITATRYLLGLFDLLMTLDLQTRRQMVRIVKSSKIGWAFGFHPDARYKVYSTWVEIVLSRFKHPLKQLNGASLDYIKQHLESLGGAYVFAPPLYCNLFQSQVKLTEWIPESVST